MSQNKKISAAPGLATMGLLLTGIAGIIHAFHTDSALGLIASALAFGIIFVVSFR